jgi:hypothetical protein
MCGIVRYSFLDGPVHYMFSLNSYATQLMNYVSIWNGDYEFLLVDVYSQGHVMVV